MRRVPHLGWLLLVTGILLVWIGLYAADSLLLLQSSLLHFFEHMQLMWEDMSWLPRALVVAGLLCVAVSLVMFTDIYRRRANPGEWY